MTSAEEDRAARLAAELAEHDQLVVALEPVEALAVIGMLQLALRHPTAPAGPSQAAVAFIERVVHAYKLRGPDSTEFVRVVSEGARPCADAEPDAAAKLALSDLDLVVDDRMPPGVFAVTSGDPAHPERGGDAVVRYVDVVDGRVHEAPADQVKLSGAVVPSVAQLVDRAAGDRAAEQLDLARRTEVAIPSALLGRRDVVRPAGLVWSGIRVDELEPIGYEVLDRAHPACPVPLEDGEILGDPAAGRIFVWSRGDFDRLAELSRALHRARRRGLDAGRVPFASSELRHAISLVEADVEALAIVRALPAGSS